MKINDRLPEYQAPSILAIDIIPESILCASNGTEFDLTLEDLKENDYTFSW